MIPLNYILATPPESEARKQAIWEASNIVVGVIGDRMFIQVGKRVRPALETEARLYALLWTIEGFPDGPGGSQAGPEAHERGEGWPGVRRWPDRGPTGQGGREGA